MSNVFDQDFDDEPPRGAPAASVIAPPSRGGNVFDADFDDSPTIPQPQAVTPNKVFGELKPAEYSWRETLGNKAQDALIALGAKPYVAGRVGRGALDAATMIPPVGASLAGADTIYYANRGQPLRAAAEAIGALPAAPLVRNYRAGGVIAGQPKRAIAPDAAELNATRNAQYRAWRNSPVVRDPAMMDDLTNAIAQTLTQRGSNQVKAPTAWAALDEGRKLKKQTGMTNEDFETLRQQFDVKNFDRPDDIIGASRARAEFDRYMTNPPPQFVRQGTPQQIAVDQTNLLNARGNTAALKRSQVLSDANTVAELKAETGRDFGKTLTGKIDALATTRGGERSTRGFTDAERAMVRATVTDPTTRRMQGAANFLQGSGARNPLVGAAMSTIPGGAVGLAAWKAAGLDPATAAIAAALTQAGAYGAGSAVRRAAGRRIAGSVEDAAANLRMRSPLAQQDPSFGIITNPEVLAKDAAKYLAYPLARDVAADAADYDRAPYQYR